MPPFLQTIIISLTVAAAALTAAAADPVKPNIVYFLIDDMGYADAGFNGCADLKTQNLDKFAREGAVLECLYGQPVCSPARAALMTGRYPVRTGVYNVTQYAALPQPLPLNERTLAQTLQAAGYTTAISGKWHLGEKSPDYLPTKRGFDHQYGFMGGGINSFTHLEGGRRDAKAADWYRNDEKCEDVIEGNTAEGVGSSGVYVVNLTGSFYEGPVPPNCIILNNVFRNTQGTPIVVGSNSASSPAAYAKNIRITGNSIQALSAPCIEAFSVSGLNISGNILSLKSSASAAVGPLSLTNIVNETISGNSMP